jgi:hypothetical protein
MRRRKFVQLATANALGAGIFGANFAAVAGRVDQLDRFGGWTGIQGKATGYFHFEEIDGRNWFVTPEGNVFFAVSLSHVFSGESDVACQNVYGGDTDAWLKGSLDKAREMGFNCALGSATSPERNLNGFVDVPKAEKLFREANFPYAVGVILLKHPWEFVDGETLPDIFHPDYARLIQSRAVEVCTRHKDDPLCMGYYYGFGAFNSSDEWVGHHLSLPEGSPGRVALVDLLIKRYAGDVAKFNRVYGTSLQEMADLHSKYDLKYGEPGWNNKFNKRHFTEVKETLKQEQFEDFEAIISLMCTTLYQLAHQSIRRWDQNHLIFGSFIKEWALSEDSWKKVAPFVDIIAPQHFDRDISVNDLADATNLPIILSDEYFGFHYPGKPFGYAGVTSHQGRKEIYQANLRRHFKDPQVIGVTYCAGMYDNGGRSLERNEQSGFYSIDGQPREDLIKAVTELNHAVYEHASKPASPEELKRLKTGLFRKWDEHRSRKQGRLW